MPFAEIFADALTAAVYVYGSIAALTICLTAAAMLLRRSPEQEIARRGDYWLRYVPAARSRHAMFAVPRWPFGSKT